MGKALGGGSGLGLAVVRRRATASLSTSGRPTIATRWREDNRSWRSTCTSTPIHIDYGAKAATYVDTFMDAIRWSNADKLFAALTAR